MRASRAIAKSRPRERGSRRAGVGRPQFVVGHVYSIEYDDHWFTQDCYRDTLTDDETYRLRARGVCIKETAKALILESQLHVTDQHPTNKRSAHHGIMKSCIVKVQHFGPEKM